MSKPTILIALGILVVFVPYLGIPGSWKTAIFVVLGVGITATALFLRQELPRAEQSDTFVESDTRTTMRHDESPSHQYN